MSCTARAIRSRSANSKMQIQDALDLFVGQLEADGRSPHTIDQYRRHVRALAAWLAHTGRSGDLAALGHQDVAMFFGAPGARTAAGTTRTKRATSVNSMRTSIRCFFAHLHAAGHVASNAAGLLKRARTSAPPPRGFHAEEQGRLLVALDADRSFVGRRDRTLVRLLLLAGPRIGSAVALDVTDIDLRAGEATLRKAKNDAPVTLVLAPSLVADLKEFIADRRDGPLFTSPTGSRVSVRNLQRRFAALLVAAKIDRKLSLHGLRHSFALSLLERTRDIAVVQRALTHKSIASTLTYARASTEDVRRALAQ